MTLRAARALAAHRARARPRSSRSASTPTTEALAAIVAATEPDYLQLHGRESPERVAEIQRKFGVSAIKAIGVAERRGFRAGRGLQGSRRRAADRRQAAEGRGAARRQRRAVRLAARRDFHPRKPWLLSGGLDADNVGEAIALSGARGVDVSSGVESAPGVKDIGKINAFVAAARAAFAQPFDAATAIAELALSPACGERNVRGA